MKLAATAVNESLARAGAERRKGIFDHGGMVDRRPDHTDVERFIKDRGWAERTVC